LNLTKTHAPYHLIKAVKPHIIVKGCDYNGKAEVGQDIAGVLKLVLFVEVRSTTKTIEKIQQGELQCKQ
jgi:D-beta-D-heptose 7-phosphate kinase/D-beta-D-heptose 1-phosphate adenosyltransferase